MATDYADIHVKVNKDVKIKSEKILDSIGISMSDLINMALRRVIFERQIPFSTQIEPEGASSSMVVGSKEELEDVLKDISAANDGELLSEKEVWANFKK